ncbi:MAG: hypothetical protein J6D21_08660 [Clostridia bacterium]|nr:hypothetical protein [Clostridia bacterium]
MKGKLILDRTERRENGEKVFVFEYEGEAGSIRFFSFAASQMPCDLVDSLRQGDIVTAEWSESALLSGTVDQEATASAAKRADDLLQRLFAKGKKK